MHDWLVRLVLEVGLPAAVELGCRPLLHLIQLLFSGTNLNTSINSIGCQRTSSLQVPFFKDLLLNLGITTNEVVKGLNFRLGSVNRESEIVILEVAADTWKIHEWFNTSLAKLFGVTNSRSLKNQWRAECASANNNLFTGAEDLSNRLFSTKRLGGNCLDSNGSSIFNDDSSNFGIAL